MPLSDYFMTEEDMYTGNKFVCVYFNEKMLWSERDKFFELGKTYSLFYRYTQNFFDAELDGWFDRTYVRLRAPCGRVEDFGVRFLPAAHSLCDRNYPSPGYAALVPRNKITDKDLFAITLGGIDVLK